MCGITGVLRWGETACTAEEIDRMTASLAHRGPDGQGTYLRPNAAIGHRRLSIIDLEGGRQPMCNEDGEVWVTFNGEIYNFKELRSQLERHGHRFKSQSDTEVIIHGYEQWGTACVERFRGMFAFAVFDFRDRLIMLARDHLGIKPLYYLESSDCFAFSSELQALRLVEGQQLNLDLQAIDQYLWVQYIPAPRTAFREISKLPPAHRMTVSFDGKVHGPEEYWQLEFRPLQGRTEAEWIEATDEVIRESVRAHLVSDVPFGAFLSGGVDSSAVVANMAQILDRPVQTFSIGFQEEDFNELHYADLAAKRWGTQHHSEIVKPDALEILPQLVRHYGEPFGDSSAIPTYYVCRLARGSVPMVLSGDGGDESFAGYSSYSAWMKWLTLSGMACWMRGVRAVLGAFFPARFPERKPTLQNWLRYNVHLGPSQRHSLWRPEHRSACQPSMKLYEDLFERVQEYSSCHRAQYMDFKTYLPNSILAKVDIASMMHGLEVRTPITDVKVVEFAATIPESFNMRRNWKGEWFGKLLLKKAMTRYYPPEFLNRPKMGFSVPVIKWFGPNGAFRHTLRERLLGPDSKLQGFFHTEAIASLISKTDAGSLWLLLFLDEWLRQNEKGVSW